MLCLAQSIEVKYSVYSKQRKAQIEKIMSNAANQGNKGLLAGMEAEKEDSSLSGVYMVPVPEQPLSSRTAERTAAHVIPLRERSLVFSFAK